MLPSAGLTLAQTTMSRAASSGVRSGDDRIAIGPVQTWVRTPSVRARKVATMKALPILITALALVSSDSSFAIIPSFLNYDDAPTLGYGASLCAYIEGPVDHSVWTQWNPAMPAAFMNITSRVSGSAGREPSVKNSISGSSGSSRAISVREK